MKRPRKLIVTVHGILTGEDACAWQDEFQHYVDLRTVHIDTLHKEYFEWPLPIINVFVKNVWVATRLANLVEPYCTGDKFNNQFDVAFLTHSNGADIAVKCIRELAERGHFIRSLVCIAGAINSDVVKTGIAELIDTRRLGRAFAYCSKDDEVLELRGIWPYGRLGAEGFTSSDPESTDTLFDSGAITTRWFPNYGHSDYFGPNHETQTFERALTDCCYL